MRTGRIDPIAQELGRLDEQLDSKSPLIECILIVSPSVILAVGFIAGICLPVRPYPSNVSVALISMPKPASPT